MSTIYDVIIIGAGPAGLTAALYTSRAGLNTLIIEREVIGGELMNRDLIENWPGSPDGILGPELGSGMTTQVMNYGAEFQLVEVEGLAIEGNNRVVKTGMGDFSARAVIIAGGACPRKLGVPGEAEFADAGVFYCATCDGPGFAGKVVVVAGGGDSGLTEGLFLAQLVSKVIIIEMLPELTATRILQDRALSNPKIEIKCGTKIEAITGSGKVEALSLLDLKTGEKSSLPADGVLVHIGLDPNTGYLQDILPLNSRGQVMVNENMETEIPGIFAAGDVRHNSAMQVSTAAGDGATAALSLNRYLKTG